MKGVGAPDTERETERETSVWVCVCVSVCVRVGAHIQALMYDIVQNSISKFLCYFMSEETPALYISFQAQISLPLSRLPSVCFVND